MKYNVLFDHSADNNVGYLAANIPYEDALDVILRNKALAVQHYGDDRGVAINTRNAGGIPVMLQVVAETWCYSLAIVPSNPFHVGH